jgi:hypothetical protein
VGSELQVLKSTTLPSSRSPEISQCGANPIIGSGPWCGKGQMSDRLFIPVVQIS